MNEQQDVNTKDALLMAAIEVFADKGFDAATVRDICGKANANVAAVNYHYGGKDALYVAVLEQIFPKQEYQEALDTNMPPEERLRIYLSGMIRELYERGNDMVTKGWSIFLREMAKPSKNLDLIVERQMQSRVDALREIVKSVLGPDTPEQVLAYASSSVWVLMLDHMMTQPILDRLTPRRPSVAGPNLDAFIDHVVRFSMGGLRAIKDTL